MLANLGVAIHGFRYELNEKRSGLPENGSMRWPLLPSLDPGKGLRCGKVRAERRMGKCYNLGQIQIKFLISKDGSLNQDDFQ